MIGIVKFEKSLKMGWLKQIILQNEIKNIINFISLGGEWFGNIL